MTAALQLSLAKLAAYSSMQANHPHHFCARLLTRAGALAAAKHRLPHRLQNCCERYHKPRDGHHSRRAALLCPCCRSAVCCTHAAAAHRHLHRHLTTTNHKGLPTASTSIAPASCTFQQQLLCGSFSSRPPTASTSIAPASCTFQQQLQ
jgi:hypothetical protein